MDRSLVGLIQINFEPGKLIKIKGTVPSVAHGFNINLQCGPQTAPQADIALQIAVKTFDGYIVLNSLQNNVWGNEQRIPSLSIKCSETFEITLQCKFNEYKISINERQCEFPQQVNYDRISHLAIDGDVSINQISYTTDTSVHPDAIPPSYEMAVSEGPPYPLHGAETMPLARPPVFVNDYPGWNLSTSTPATSIPPPLSNEELCELMKKHKKVGFLWFGFLLTIVIVAIILFCLFI